MIRSEGYCLENILKIDNSSDPFSRFSDSAIFGGRLQNGGTRGEKGEILTSTGKNMEYLKIQEQRGEKHSSLISVLTYCASSSFFEILAATKIRKCRLKKAKNFFF